MFAMDLNLPYAAQSQSYKKQVVQLRNPLALAELEATASLGLTWLLTFNDTCIAGEEACLAESGLRLSVDLDECTCDGEAESACLAIIATTLQVNLDVVLLSYADLVERLLDDILKD